MRFLSPHMLWLLLAAPVLAAAYIALLRRKKAAVRYASVALIRGATGGRRQLRRHMPALLFLAALILVVLAIARPTGMVTLPYTQRTVILAMDVSLSMRAADVSPTRLAAAQAAAKAFVASRPPDVRVGIVSFAGTAAVVQPPAYDREKLFEAIDRLQPEPQTAIGSGLIMSLATMLPRAGIDLRQYEFGTPAGHPGARSGKAHTPVPAGSYRDGAIILLTDGRRTTGPDPLDAARLAAEYGVRVYTVGFGSAQGAPVKLDGWSIFMRFDEETLKSIAAITHAEYFPATSAEALKKVYRTLDARLEMERKRTELSALFAAAAALLGVASAALSVLWFHRPA